jgi:folate-binding protein YgfZ
MEKLILHDLHLSLGASFASVKGAEVVDRYGDIAGEYDALVRSAGVLDFSFRSRLCVLGNDRVRFLHGQVTNDIKKLKAGEGCYAALVTAKGRTESDLNIYCLPDELLLDFEPGLGKAVTERLEKYIIADDVQLVDVAELYGMLTVQGPRAAEAVQATNWVRELPSQVFSFVNFETPAGEGYLVNRPRAGGMGYDLFLPTAELRAASEKLINTVRGIGGRPVGWHAFEMARIEAGIPRFGADIDASNIPLEAGLEKQAISFSKGCYIGQEVISRIKTYSEVSKSLKGLRLDPGPLPVKGDKLFHAGREAGYVTSAIELPKMKGAIALGYVRKEVNQLGTQLSIRTAAGDAVARLVELPFKTELAQA